MHIGFPITKPKIEGIPSGMPLIPNHHHLRVDQPAEFRAETCTNLNPLEVSVNLPSAETNSQSLQYPKTDGRNLKMNP